jgi:sarcosine oxidase
MPPRSFLVVGAGLAGASTAWRLAQRGCEVTLVERRTPAAPDGSSHGSARIFRYAYPDRLYVDLVAAARPGWDELAAVHGAPLLVRTGALDFGELRDPHGLATVLAAAGIEHEVVPAAQARDRWPGIAADGDVLVHPGAGVLDAERTVQAMVEAARSLGVRILTDWPVHRLERGPSGIVAVADDGRTVDAEHVVVAAGGWLPDLLGRLDLPAGFLAAFPQLTVREENAFHFPYRSGADEPPWPALIHQRPGIDVYALPGGRDADFRGQKVARFNGGRSIGSARRRTGIVDPDNRAWVVDYVRHFLPGLVPEPYAETTCLFTNTPSEDFVIDTADGVTVLSPCSGHGAKFAPVIGTLAADAAMGTRAVPDRFRVGAHR